MTQPQQHCEHECVCPAVLGVERSRNEPCKVEGSRAHCQHDTRSRYAPTHNAKTNPLESDSRGYRCIHCEISNEVLFCHYTDKQIISLPQHDAAIATKEREDVLKEFEVVKWVTITAPDLSLGRDEIVWIRKKDLLNKIKSLRSTKEAQR
jgi:hypothetical protein